MKSTICFRVACLSLLPLVCMTCVAQASLKLPLDPAGITALNAKTKDGYTALGKIYALKDFDKEMAQLPALVAENKDFVISNNGNANVVFSISGLLKKNHPEGKTLSAQLASIDKSYKDNLPPYAFGYFASRIAPVLLKQDYPEEAKRYASISVALFNEDDCLMSERFEDADRALYEQTKSKTPIKHVYYEVDGEGHCAGDQASRIAVLGKIEAKLGETQDAVASFNAALKIHSNMDAYVGLATIDEASGDKAGALRLLTAAYLTGRLDPENIAKAQALYLELNPGSTLADYSAQMDADYAKTFSNPVKASAALPAPTGSHHVVLDEFFTGADCEPCTSPDLATEAALERYSREQLVLAVYHNNAPSSDPLTNDVGEDRAKYYSTEGSTPHTFLNGKELELEEGLGTHAQIAFEELTSDVDKLLASPAEGSLQVGAVEKGSAVEVTVSAKPGKAQRKLHLQVLLLENPVSYSGYNTLRFHPMVVRASAEDAHGARGFILPVGGAVAHTVTFDLKKIEEANLAYYEESKQALVKKLSAAIASGAFDKKEVEKMGEFREHKNLIDPKRLAVVAFLQDDATKRVLTATYAVVIPETVAEAK
jgi:tetratricopeptide (TPR) repeat protein